MADCLTTDQILFYAPQGGTLLTTEVGEPHITSQLYLVQGYKVWGIQNMYSHPDRVAPDLPVLALYPDEAESSCDVKCWPLVSSFGLCIHKHDMPVCKFRKNQRVVDIFVFLTIGIL